VSKLLRRLHLYLALFLGPWVLGYGASTIIMNHGWVAPQRFTLERTQHYEAVFAPGATPRQQARQILSDLGLEGAFGVQGPDAAGRLTITRQDLVAPRRVVFAPADAQVSVERVEFQTTSALSRFHHRRTYQQPYLADHAMAASIDVMTMAMLFWAFSGLWMWWETRATRVWGAVFGLLGAGLFLFFAVTL
jgi:hypothetical protein